MCSLIAFAFTRKKKDIYNNNVGFCKIKRLKCIHAMNFGIKYEKEDKLMFKDKNVMIKNDCWLQIECAFVV